MFTHPLSHRLADCDRILLAGAGGGFDFVSALPFFLALRAEGKTPFLANLTFTRFEAIDRTTAEPVTDDCLAVTAATTADTGYFPEHHVARWFAERGDTGDEAVPVFTIHRTGVRGVRAAYAELAAQLQLDAVVLVDGGTDSLMRGDEIGLGTPAEDATSLAAVHWLDAPSVRERLLVCVGFGVDAYHGVCHASFLEAVAALVPVGGYLGSFALTAHQPEAQARADCVDWLNRAMPTHPSIVCNSIRDALLGIYGNHHSTHRTHGSELWINPLMTLAWCFDLPAAAAANLYLERIRDTASFVETIIAIDDFHDGIERRPFQSIPV